MIPKGSSDPFALRRAAQGVVKILAEGALAVTTIQVIAGDAQLEKFLLDRVDYYFREIRGFAYDEVNAVLAAGWADLRDVQQRLDAVRDVRKSENFEPLAAAFKRIKNILKQAQFEKAGAVDPARLEPGPEQELHAEYERVRAAAQTASGYGETLAAIATLRPAVDRFFDAVMVNVEDAAVRENRLTLLRSLLVEFSTLADFSEIVTLA
jgi:glycyl-tRNA synthetase beta chain